MAMPSPNKAAISTRKAPRQGIRDRPRASSKIRVYFEALRGSGYNPDAFRAAYQAFNQVEFHPFTADNQDYLVYICLSLSSGLISLPDLIQAVRTQRLPKFTYFLTYVDERRASLPAKVRGIHRSVFDRVRAGDPTPFKTFRYNEFKRTVQHMGHLPETAAVEQILAEEIVITAEIRDLANRWKDRGVLLFGLSDKPDEAILPTAALKAQGYSSVHRTLTHVIGEA